MATPGDSGYSDYSLSPSPSASPFTAEDNHSTNPYDANGDAPPKFVRDKSLAESPLFQLPRELRDRIYSYCLTTPYAVLWPSNRCNTGLQPQLLQTCSAIFHEAASVLYSTNMLHFQHPSDCNMFLWAHNPILGRLMTKMLLQVKDRDVRPLWSPYLSSTSTSRSLLCDFPHLQTLHVQLKSSFLLLMGGSLEDKFRRWDGDKPMNALCLALEGRTPEDCDVKLLVCTRTSSRDVQYLLNAFSSELKRVNGLTWKGDREDSIIVRTYWRTIKRASVALELEGVGGDRSLGP